jgi:hypothetical protein
VLVIAPFLTPDYGDVVNFVRQDVTRSIEILIPPMIEEVKLVFAQNFPPAGSTPASDTQDSEKPFSQVAIHPATLVSVGSVTSRMLFGKKYSHDKTFTDTACSLARSIGLNSLFLPSVPSFLIPLLVLILPTRRLALFLQNKIKDDILSVKDTPVSELREQLSGPNAGLLPLMVKYVQSRPGYEDASDEELLAGVNGRLMGLVFAVIDTSSMTFTQVVHDLVGHALSDYRDPLLAEIRKTQERNGGVWNLKSLGELRLLDSFIKESQRLHPVGMLLASRLIVPSAGYTFGATNEKGSEKREPIHLSQGTMVQLPTYGVHTDPEIYPSPLTFQGFRFAQDAIASSQPSDKFLSFGHGMWSKFWPACIRGLGTNRI